MAHATNEIDVIKQLFGNLSQKDKEKFIAEISSDKSTVCKVIKPKVISSCPRCQSTHFVKNGQRNGKQNFLCRGCKKAFVENTGTILFSMKKDISVLEKYIHCMVQKYSLRKCAEICEINLATAFAWRHKILDALQNMMDEVQLDGVVQADETFTTISYKGNHKDFVNNYHSRFKDLIIHKFKGVATKYLNNYLVYHNFVNFAKDSLKNKEIVLMDFIRTVSCISLTSEISKRPPIPV